LTNDEYDISELTPARFAQIISDGYWQPAEHLLLIDNYLQSLINREFRGLIVNMPPRHGKSEFISTYFPAWHLIRFPDKRIILTTYSNQFAALWGRRVKEIIVAKGKLFDIDLKHGASASASFEIEGHRGGMHSAGAGSSITGRGADLIIIDDPVKNNMDAFSGVKRDSLWDWFNSTAMTRLEPFGVIVLLMTRWHPDDLTGRILQNYRVVTVGRFPIEYKDSKIWLHLSLPAIANDNDPLGRLPGEALWAERYDLDELVNIKNNIGAHWFEAMYQQNPLPAENCIFNREDFRYFHENDDYFIINGKANQEKYIFKSDCIINITVDLAISDKDSADYTVAIVFAVTPENLILILEVLRLKISGIDLIYFFEQLKTKWQPQAIGIESVQFQTALIEQLLDLGFNVKKLRPNANKRTRALGISIMLGNHRVYFKAKAKWLHDFEKELMEFPNGRHDDQADAFAYIDRMLQFNANLMPVGSRKRTHITRGFF
jgi:predicted phage terminase large subunit-like protein